MDTIYVSLGSTCEISHILKYSQLRKQAFPFDWITTIDSDKFIQLIQDDFKFFLDPKYLVSTNIDPFPLINTYYNIEFLHDGIFNNELFEQKKIYNNLILIYSNTALDLDIKSDLYTKYLLGLTIS